MSGVSESERVGSAYELGAAVADGSEPALQQLIRGLTLESAEACRRAAMYGLASA
jgi:hypothetical protein